MSDAEWDADDFEPPPLNTGKPVTDKWGSEDEEDEIKDAWDESSEEDATKESSPALDEDGLPKALQVKKKKKLDKFLKEKEDKKKKDQEDLKKAKERLKELTAEEKAAEKARIKKEQEAADLELARQVFGLDDIDESESIDKLSPVEPADFISFREALTNKLKRTESSPHYSEFLNQLLKNLCLKMDVEHVRKINTGLLALENEKRKEAKKTKKAAKSKKGAPSVKLGKETDEVDPVYDAYGDLDDFM